MVLSNCDHSLSNYDHSLTIFEILQFMVIVTNIWQKLSSVEREGTLIVTDFWRLFSQIFGRTVLPPSYLCGHDILFLSRLSTSWRYDAMSSRKGESIMEAEE